jgi:hypothetical protein
MRKTLFIYIFSMACLIQFTSCSTTHRGMREPNTRVNFERQDFELSDQVSAEAKQVKILGIDFKRLLGYKGGVVGPHDKYLYVAVNIPVIGNNIFDRTVNYSLYNLMNDNPGYDVVFYPQYEVKVKKPILGMGFVYKVTDVKTSARLGKLK